MSTAKPDGWHALRQIPGHTLRDGLYINGFLRATVEAFGDEGPWYVNAITPDDERRRCGVGISHTAAAEWCERITGYSVASTRGPAGQTKGGL